MNTKTKSLSKHIKNQYTPQTQPLNSRQIINSEGGYVYAVSHWDQLDRFLIIGSTNGNFYISEKNLTKQNVESLKKCLDLDPKRYVDRVTEISKEGRAAKNDYAIFALAYACNHSANARKEALQALNDVCRIGTHLFQFMEDYKTLGGGFGRSVRRAISNWYTAKDIDNLSNQLVKYRNRNSWNHRDVLRLVHTHDERINHILRYAVKGWESDVSYPDIINAYEMLKNIDSLDTVNEINKYAAKGWQSEAEFMSETALKKKANVQEAVNIINQYDVTRESWLF